jgi:glutamate/tyrosine decarboxylase-like PLP-dependent enzyme
MLFWHHRRGLPCWNYLPSSSESWAIARSTSSPPSSRACGKLPDAVPCRRRCGAPCSTSRSFSLVPAYLRDDAALPWFSEFGVQQSRGFRALKLWLCLHQAGRRGYRDLIAADIARARALQDRIRRRPAFELVAAGPLSVTCFRYAPPGATDLDGLNRRVLDVVQREGKVFLTSTELDGRLVLRACIINFRTRDEDLDALLDCIEETGGRVRGELSAGDGGRSCRMD